MVPYILLLILLSPSIILGISAFKDIRDILREDTPEERQRPVNNPINNDLSAVLFSFFKAFKESKPGPIYVSDAYFILRKAINKETNYKGVIVWLEDMCRRMESEYYPRDTKLVRECIEEIKKVGA